MREQSELPRGVSVFPFSLTYFVEQKLTLSLLSLYRSFLPVSFISSQSIFESWLIDPRVIDVTRSTTIKGRQLQNKGDHLRRARTKTIYTRGCTTSQRYSNTKTVILFNSCQRTSKAKLMKDMPMYQLYTKSSISKTPLNTMPQKNRNIETSVSFVVAT